MLLNELKQYKPYSLSPGYNAQQIVYGFSPTDGDIIKGTTYVAKKENSKAMTGLVSCHQKQYQITMTKYQNTFSRFIVETNVTRSSIG